MKKITTCVLSLLCATLLLFGCAKPSTDAKNETSQTTYNVAETTICEAYTESTTAPYIPDSPRTIKATYTSTTLGGYTLPYTLILPENYSAEKTYPVMLFLHGAGERGSDNCLHINSAVSQLYTTRPDLLDNAIFLAPQCPEGEKWVNTPWNEGNYSTDATPESNALGTAMEILSKVMTDYSCDENRIYLFGISMGGYGTWDALVRHNSTFAAAIPLCGGGDESKAQLLAKTPIWCVHGTDDLVVQFEGTQRMASAIIAAGGSKLIFTPLENTGHDVWTYATTNPELIGWLFSQQKQLS